MRAIILAAGMGSRLRPLTDHCPKPLLNVGGKSLIAYHIENLKRAGIEEIIINLFHLGEQIEAYVGSGAKWDVSIRYSWEPHLLEVGGGIFHALPLLGHAPFIVINGDIWTDYPLENLVGFSQNLSQDLGHLVLVNNPEHNTKGDFAMGEKGVLSRSINACTYTYAGISVLHPSLFQGCVPGQAFRLAPLLDNAILSNQLSGQIYGGKWTDVGTLERLQRLENSLALRPSTYKI
jgi:MurNAc alpha-1-phosphate uridylyltransferase